MFECQLEAFGMIPGTIEWTLPDAMIIALMFAAIVVGGLIVRGWPVMIAILWFFRDDLQQMVSAILSRVAAGPLALGH